MSHALVYIEALALALAAELEQLVKVVQLRDEVALPDVGPHRDEVAEARVLQAQVPQIFLRKLVHMHVVVRLFGFQKVLLFLFVDLSGQLEN